MDKLTLTLMVLKLADKLVVVFAYDMMVNRYICVINANSPANEQPLVLSVRICAGDTFLRSCMSGK